MYICICICVCGNILLHFVTFCCSPFHPIFNTSRDKLNYYYQGPIFDIYNFWL
ncbi:hypothetical protein CLU79DRAFT_747181 [Phycomyces nitens]|nr:hypothetical protein CLU79DRAFT_747181 [Phycomyces nitens]